MSLWRTGGGRGGWVEGLKMLAWLIWNVRRSGTVSVWVDLWKFTHLCSTLMENFTSRAGFKFARPLRSNTISKEMCSKKEFITRCQILNISITDKVGDL